MQGKANRIGSLLLSLALGFYVVGCGSSHHSGSGSPPPPSPSPSPSPSGFAITTTNLPPPVLNAAYSTTLAASGGSAPYAFNVSFGALPVGLTLNSSGQITGTPTHGETQTFTVTAADANSQTASQQFTLTVQVFVTLTTLSLPNGTVGSAYSTSLTATGGTPPFTWSVLSGSLAPGLSLNTSSGAITGTPTAAGTFPVQFQVRDSANAVGASTNLSITVN